MRSALNRDQALGPGTLNPPADTACLCAARRHRLPDSSAHPAYHASRPPQGPWAARGIKSEAEIFVPVQQEREETGRQLDHDSRRGH